MTYNPGPTKTTIIQPPWWNTDSAVTDNASTELIDGILQQKPGGSYLLHKRPGLKELVDPGTNSAGQGCHYSESLNAFFSVSNGNLWKYYEAGTTTTLVGGGLSLTNSVIFAEGQNLDSSTIIYIADGANLKYTDGTTLTNAATTDANAPYLASHVVWFSNRFIANEPGTPFFYATGVNPGSGDMDNTYWSSAFNPMVAEQKGDNVNALAVSKGELYVAGVESIEIWQDDGVTPLFPIPSYTIDSGIVAPYSVCNIDENIYALTRYQGELSVVSINGVTPNVKSAPIANLINDYSKVDDAIGFHVFTGGFSFYILTFPTENVTWAYDIKYDYWARWGQWDSDLGDYGDYLGLYAAYASKWNTYLVLSQNDGRVYSISRDYLTDAGASIRTSFISANFDYGTLNRKRCNSARFYIKTVNSINTGSHIVRLRMRDNGKKQWGNYFEFNIDSSVEPSSYPHRHRMGIFRSRQYNFVFDDYTNVVIGDIELEFEQVAD